MKDGTIQSGNSPAETATQTATAASHPPAGEVWTRFETLLSALMPTPAAARELTEVMKELRYQFIGGN
jgi:hypothetical protein